MTALFVAIFIEQFRTKQNRLPGLIGLAGTALCLVVFGPGRFMLPAMALLVLVLTLIRSPLERSMETQ